MYIRTCVYIHSDVAVVGDVVILHCVVSCILHLISVVPCKCNVVGITLAGAFIAHTVVHLTHGSSCCIGILVLSKCNLCTYVANVIRCMYYYSCILVYRMVGDLYCLHVCA